MKFTRKKAEQSIEKNILVGSIVNDRFVREISSILDYHLLSNPFISKVTRWVLKYFQQYDKSPKKDIEGILKSKIRQGELAEEEVDMVTDLIDELSEEYSNEKFNVDYLLDQAEEYLSQRSLQILSEDIVSGIGQGSVKEIENLVSNYQRKRRPASEGINPFGDLESIKSAFEDSGKPLFELAGVLGKTINRYFTRDAFVSILAPEKRGKTWWLCEFAYQAYRQGNKVAYFDAGDMSRFQIIKRFGIRLAGKSDRAEDCGYIDIPILDCIKNQENRCTSKRRTCDVGAGMRGYEACSACYKKNSRNFEGAVHIVSKDVGEPLSWKEVFKLGDRLVKHYGIDNFKMINEPNDTLNITGIKGYLEAWKNKDGFLPDVIIIDYADILAPEPNAPKEFRHNENKTWKALRSLSQEYHCLVITATQADASAYDAKHNLSMKNFSEDKRKNAHVTAMITLNQTEEDKDNGIMKIGTTAVREGNFNSRNVVHVLHSYQIGKPYIASYLA